LTATLSASALIATRSTFERWIGSFEDDEKISPRAL
jgi:hypothetical protein